MLVRVPASSANLGPGFDTLAVALALYIEVSLESADSLVVTSEGCGAGLFDDERHLGVQVASSILGHDNFSLHVKSSIPLSRGLGSSAALAVGAAAAAGSLDAFGVGARCDGHAENAGASTYGGLVVAGIGEDARPVARQMPIDERWVFVAVIPDEELATPNARSVLPQSVSLHDATFNLNAFGLLLAGLARCEDFVVWSMDDRLHQPYRMSLVTFAENLLTTLREAGAAGSCWSGAGSTMLALVERGDEIEVRDAASAFLKAASIPGEVLVLEVDRTGVVTT